MKKSNVIYAILFGLLMLVMFAPALEARFHLFKFKPFSGVYVHAPKPEFSFDNYKEGKWQSQTEKYVSENFGFREPVIRLYNQYVYDFFKKTYSNEISIGEDGWLYHRDGVQQYYGLLGQRFQLDNEQIQENLDVEIRSLVKIRAILKEYGVELMTFTLPVKSYIYPEHLRPQPFVDTMFHADTYYDYRLREANYPHINMTPWFQDIRDDYPFTLFYEKGSHWAAGAVLATDSLFRFMETLKGDHLARIVMGTPYEVPENKISSQDQDLAALLNISRKLKQHLPLYEIPVSIEADSNTVWPTALFIGTSYFWYITPRVPFEKVFSDRDLIFYNASYYTNEEKTIIDLKKINLLRELLTHDYVIYFKNGPQLYNDNFQFFGKALISLCISEKRFSDKLEKIADYLMEHATPEQAGWTREQFLYSARYQLYKNPELFEELRGDNIPTIRNPKINDFLTERQIRADRTWNFLLECNARHDSITLDRVYDLEIQNLKQGRPLIKNKTYFNTYDYFNYLVEETIDEMRRSPENTCSRVELRPMAIAAIDSLVAQNAFVDDTLMRMACTMSTIIQRIEGDAAIETLREKAKSRGFSIDRMFKNDVVWSFHNRDMSPFMDENTIRTQFERFKIEDVFWHDGKSINSIVEKAKNNDIPFRAAIDRDIQWCLNNKK